MGFRRSMRACALYVVQNHNFHYDNSLPALLLCPVCIVRCWLVDGYCCPSQHPPRATPLTTAIICPSLGNQF